MVEAFIGAVALALEALAAAVVLVGAVVALAQMASAARRGRADSARSRRSFSHTLLFALDLTAGADVLQLGLAPTLHAVAVVGGVVVARVVLTLVLVHELKNEEVTR